MNGHRQTLCKSMLSSFIQDPAFILAEVFPISEVPPVKGFNAFDAGVDHRIVTEGLAGEVPLTSESRECRHHIGCDEIVHQCYVKSAV